MAHRGKNYQKGQAAQAAAALATLKAMLARAVSRGVCPECGAALHREGAALVCHTRECGGVGAVVFRCKCFEAEATAR